MKKITGQERIDLIADIKRRIAEDTQVIGAPERAAVWQFGWNEALTKFRTHPVTASLIPAFIHDDRPIRWKQDFYWPTDAIDSELAQYREMQEKIGDWLFECHDIVEFGCGTGFNLVALAERLPDKIFHGFDFAPAAVELVNEAGWSLQHNITASTFNMLDPWMGFALPRDAGVFTFGAIEQLASNFEPFMEYLILQRPKLVVHVEPCLELLDPDNEVDALAIAFMQKRQYSVGLLPWLQDDARVEVVDIERTGYGSTMIEGFNFIVWRMNA